MEIVSKTQRDPEDINEDISLYILRISENDNLTISSWDIYRLSEHLQIALADVSRITANDILEISYRYLQDIGSQPERVHDDITENIKLGYPQDIRKW